MSHDHGDAHQDRPADPPPQPPQLFIAVALATLSGAVVAFELVEAGELVPSVLRGAILGATIVAWSSYFFSRYDQRVHFRLDRIEEMLDMRLRRASYAEGFVAGAARQVPEPAQLRSVGGR